MKVEQIAKVIQWIKVPLNQPQFLSRAHSLMARWRKKRVEPDSVEAFCAEEYEEMSRAMDATKIQDSCSARTLFRARWISYYLINDEGQLQKENLTHLLEELKRHRYFIGPHYSEDAPRQEHLIAVVEQLIQGGAAVQILQRISRPYANPHADQLIRLTLELPEGEWITDAHARRAVLSAWLCYLRQNVGSCFATAPAILIQSEQPTALLKDLQQLMESGRLKRTFGGVEYMVPMSASWGSGDLKRFFSLPRQIDESTIPIWNSPGLLRACIAAKLFDEALPEEEQPTELRRQLRQLLYKKEAVQAYVVTSTEDLIGALLRQKLGVTEEDLQEHRLRQRGGPMNVMAVGVSTLNHEKAQACNSFFDRFPLACQAFKSLTDHPLLRVWEFTLASFSEIKNDFSTWNLYSSLGMSPSEPGGIGAAFVKETQGMLDRYNAEVREHEESLDYLMPLIRHMETRIRNMNQQEAQWTRAELQSRVNEYDTIVKLRDAAARRARLFAQLGNFLTQLYINLFPRYFQEIYDADMRDVTAGPYDDSPAGFRLYYKHGRSLAAQWTAIDSPQEYVEALASFFTATENEVLSHPDLENERVQPELTQIITTVIRHIRSEEFLESAFTRMAKAHRVMPVKNPLANLDKVEKKPWVYTSGGNMKTLVTTYYSRAEPMTEASRWIESPLELLVWLVDLVKLMPNDQQKIYLHHPRAEILMQSPTHAFLFKPSLSPIFQASLDEQQHPFTWMRDVYVVPRQNFLDLIFLDESAMNFLTERLLGVLPESFRYLTTRQFSQMYGTMSPPEFREALLEMITKGVKAGYRPSGNLTPDWIDSQLYEMLPLQTVDRVRSRLEELFAAVPEISESQRSEALQLFDAFENPFRDAVYVTAKELLDMARGLLCLTLTTTSTPFDLPLSLAKAAQELGFVMPVPLFFADTNWVREFFAMVVNPGTGQLELWRVDYKGTHGAPMADWNQWLNGSRRDVPWIVFTEPRQYKSD